VFVFCAQCCQLVIVTEDEHKQSNDELTALGAEEEDKQYNDELTALGTNDKGKQYN
jgi:hypothetical protein